MLRDMSMGCDFASIWDGALGLATGDHPGFKGREHHLCENEGP